MNPVEIQDDIRRFEIMLGPDVKHHGNPNVNVALQLRAAEEQRADTTARKAVAEEAFQNFDFAKEGIHFTEASGWKWTEPRPASFQRAIYIEQDEAASRAATFIVTLNDDGTFQNAYINY